MPFPLPALQAEVAFTTGPGTTPVWVDVTPQLRAFSTQRGRQYALGRYEAGTASVKLDNRDRRFDPSFAGDLVNLISNPSLETNTTGYSANAAAIVRNNNGPNSHGTYGLVVTTTNVQGSGVAYGGAGLLPVTSGQAYAASWYVRLASAGTKTMGMLVLWLDAGSAIIGLHDTQFTLTQTSHTRITVKGIAPANAVRVAILMQTYASGQGVFDFYVDALQFEAFSATLRNLISNPSVEIDLAGYLVGISSIARNNNGPNAFGTWGIVCTTTNASDSGFSYGGASLLPVTSGQSYTASCYCRLANAGSKNFELLIVYFNASNNITGFFENVFDMTQVVQRVSVSGTAPPGTTYAAVVLNTKIGGQGVFDFWADAFQFEQGTGVIHNMVSNPSGETTSNGYASIAGTLTRPLADGLAHIGTDHFTLATTNVTGSGLIYGDATLLPVTPGLTYTASWYARLAVGGAKSMGMLILWCDANDNIDSFDDLPFTLSSTTYGRISVTGTAPATATHAKIIMETYAPEGIFSFYTDALQFEQAGAATAYSDGDQDGYHWSGTAHASPSMFATPILTDYLDGDQPNGVWSGDQHDSPSHYAPVTFTDYIDGDQDNGRWSGTAHASTSYRGGPYYPNVKPMRKLRLSATYNVTTYRLYTGFVDGWPQSWPGNRDGVVEVPATDGFKVLSLTKLTAELDAPYPTQQSGSRVAAILDAADWLAADRNLDAGVSTIQPSAFDKVSALEHLQLVELSENGRLFIQGDGVLRFESRHSPYLTTSQFTFTGEYYHDPVVDYDDTQIWNEITVTRAAEPVPEGAPPATPPVPQIKSDSTSQADYLIRSLPRDGIVVENDNEAEDAADSLLEQYKDPKTRISAISVSPAKVPAILWPQVLGRELGERVTVTVEPPGGGAPLSQESFIEGVDLRYAASPRSFDATYRLSAVGIGHLIYPAGKGFFILNDATYGKIGSSNPGVLVY